MGGAEPEEESDVSTFIPGTTARTAIAGGAGNSFDFSFGSSSSESFETDCDEVAPGHFPAPQQAHTGSKFDPCKT